MEQKIIEKIQKLLALSESPNQNEAEAAMAKAQELMVKHNIEMSSVQDHDSEYINETTETFQREGVETKYVNSILTEFFFVKIIKSNRIGFKYFNFVGEKNNVKTALHMRQYLTNTFKHLWNEYKQETGAPTKAKQSFYYGLWQGFSAKMQEQRVSAQEKYEMVLVEDPKVEEKVQELFKNLRKGGSRSVNAGDSAARSAGYSQGRNLNVNSGAITA